MKEKAKVLVIVGPTASGKTSLSIELAKHFSGEVISADSRQVYRGLNLGTGKVTKYEMQGIPHYLLDIADPEEVYTVASFVSDGRVAISTIISRNHLPIIVGGTFFYIDALLGKLSFPQIPPNPVLRTELKKLDANALFELLKAEDPAYAEIVDRDNPRRLVRAIEVIDALGHMPKTSVEPLYESLTLGIETDTETLSKNIQKRLTDRIEAGMIKEVQKLHEHGLTYERMEDLGLEYRYIARYLKNELPYCEMINEIETKSRQFAKRQMTWLKRDKNIVWVNPKEIEKNEGVVKNFLNVPSTFNPASRFTGS